MAICFDAQFPEVWQRLEDKGAQLVLFSSAYSAGQSLGAYAMLHDYYVVSSCWSRHARRMTSRAKDCSTSRKGASRIVLDLDRRIFHNNDSYNYRGQRAKLLEENPGVVIDKWLSREDWHVLRAAQPGVDLPALVKKYDLQNSAITSTSSAGRPVRCEAGSMAQVPLLPPPLANGCTTACPHA